MEIIPPDKNHNVKDGSIAKLQIFVMNVCLELEQSDAFDCQKIFRENFKVVATYQFTAENST